MWKCLICNKKIKDTEAHYFVTKHYAFENLKPRNERKNK